MLHSFIRTYSRKTTVPNTEIHTRTAREREKEIKTITKRHPHIRQTAKGHFATHNTKQDKKNPRQQESKYPLKKSLDQKTANPLHFSTSESLLPYLAFTPHLQRQKKITKDLRTKSTKKTTYVEDERRREIQLGTYSVSDGGGVGTD